MTIKMIDSEAMFGYTQKTTFYMDFSIADNYGVEAIKDTFRRAFIGWRDDYIYLTEFVMVLNWKIWEHYGSDDEYAELYNDLWEMASEYAVNNLKGDELSYYYRTTD